ncbi:response regulator [Mucilaginibacter sp. RS28]|uniref:histidine kinase n=1 Tax=Mucilaginibacter straminoryzae TaxID=2932774 RepID=A0A9X1X322_9SPHI|nr:hybrid sensor histidine kinase/response regulator transcription factor [Mucilaginibacter straminoryzae]MCJ8208633.1 response regulator [Mucilaginibacter straminoryzae]
MRRIIPMVLLLAVLLTLAVQAHPYYFKHYQVDNGMSNNTVFSCIQDRQGFLWAGTRDGLNRFDGYSFKVFRHNRKDPKSLGNDLVHALYQDNNNIIWVGTDAGLYKYNPQTENFCAVKPFETEGIACITQDRKGNMWIVIGGAIYIYNDKTHKVINLRDKQHFEADFVAINRYNEIWASSTTGTIEKYNPADSSFTAYDVFKNSKPVSSNYIEKIFFADDSTLFVGTRSQGLKLFNTRKGTYFDALTTNDNHTAIFVREILKYNNNTYWIATESGIYIYDRQKNTFINLKKRYNDPYSISDNAVYCLFRDREGGVWAGTYFGGLNYYPKQYTTFRKYYPGMDNAALNGNVVREICKDQYGNFWFGTEDNGLNKLSADKTTWTHFHPVAENKVSNTNIHGLLCNGRYLYVGTFERGMDIIDIPTGKLIKHFTSGPGPKQLKSNFIVCFCKTRAGVILVGSTVGLYRFDPATDSFTLIEDLQNSFIYSIIEDHAGNIWVGTLRRGIYKLNLATNKAQPLNYHYPIKDVLERSTVNNIFEDSSHQLWFATEGYGLWLYNPATGRYRFFDNENGLPSNYVFRTVEDNNHALWVSTSRGLVNLTKAGTRIKIFTRANGLLSDQFNYNSSFKDSDGTLYFGCVKGLISFNPGLFGENNFPAPVYITGFQVHDKEISVNQPNPVIKQSVIFTKAITLKYNQSSFSIDFAKLSFTAPEMTQYKYRMDGLDYKWTYLKTNRKAYFTELPPGNYTFIVKAANPDGTWNPKETRLQINILPPIWQSKLAYIIYAATILAIILFLIRAYHRNTKQKNQRIIEQLENNKEKQIYNAKIEFFTNVAHEIRTPLTLIKGPMEKVMKKAESVPDLEQNLKIMEKNTNRLIELTDQLLDFRKTETSGFSLNFVKVNITELLADTFLQFKPIAEQKNLSYNLLLSAQTVFAYVDLEAMRKILSNLVNNAIKYSSSAVEIRLLEHDIDDHTFTIEVRNNGYLIPYEMRERIFEPFFRMKETEKQVGTGIGLPLSRSLAELHKGVLVLSKTTDDFNTFTLTLPIHQDKEFDLYSPVGNYKPIDDIKYENTDSMKPVILVVDDNPDILDFIAQDLSEKYTVLKALSAKEASDFLETEHIQLIISDIMMPGTDGYQLCKAIKTDFNYSHIPLIMLTAKNTLQSKIEGLEVGADAYIEKPFSPEHLQVQIANLLINRNKIKDHYASSPLVHMKSMAYSKSDENFLDKLNAVIFKNIENPDLDVEQIASLMNMSKPTLYRKVKGISNLTINELINITRLKVAANLLEEGDYKIYEVATMVGYSSQSHLGRNFLKQFGITPSEYQQQKKAMLG